MRSELNATGGWIGLAVLLFVLSVLGWMAVKGCQDTAGVAAPIFVATALPSTTSSTPPPTPKVPVWVPAVRPAALLGSWGNRKKGPWALLTERAKGVASPYPWRVVVWPWNPGMAPRHATALHCGFFTALRTGRGKDPDWRVAWCRGGLMDRDGPVAAMRLVLLVPVPAPSGPAALKIQVGTEYATDLLQTTRARNAQ